MDITIGTKYCGGCNPNYDRKETANNIERRLEINLVPYNENEIPDITLIICGCSADCIRMDRYKSKYRTILINDPGQIEDVIKYVNFIKERINDSNQI